MPYTKFGFEQGLLEIVSLVTTLYVHIFHSC